MADDTLKGALDSKDKTNADTEAATEGGLLDGEEVRFNARIPEPLRDAFSDLCNRKGATMSGAVKRYMLQSVKDGEL
ncbi:hypothetical protein [Salinibacter ruber]|jgi:hypothetical protein|uniref:hypothetical protein n=1 Tax=Salinibacter ruber TaxID=146919 RepID=UPI000E58F188|nr:hypothetical protein [Salinibacter ruber]